MYRAVTLKQLFYILNFKYKSEVIIFTFRMNLLLCSYSGNLYKIFTYVKNKDAEFGDQPHTVSGMLLYAQTDEIVQPNHVYHMSGNKITVRTLDLNQPFSQIAAQLDSIVVSHFE